MHRKLIIPILTIGLVSLACNLFSSENNSRSYPTPPPAPQEEIVDECQKTELKADRYESYAEQDGVRFLTLSGTLAALGADWQNAISLYSLKTEERTCGFYASPCVVIALPPEAGVHLTIRTMYSPDAPVTVILPDCDEPKTQIPADTKMPGVEDPCLVPVSELGPEVEISPGGGGHKNDVVTFPKDQVPEDWQTLLDNLWRTPSFDRETVSYTLPAGVQVQKESSIGHVLSAQRCQTLMQGFIIPPTITQDQLNSGTLPEQTSISSGDSGVSIKLPSNSQAIPFWQKLADTDQRVGVTKAADNSTTVTFPLGSTYEWNDNGQVDIQLGNGDPVNSPALLEGWEQKGKCQLILGPFMPNGTNLSYGTSQPLVIKIPEAEAEAWKTAALADGRITVEENDGLIILTFPDGTLIEQNEQHAYVITMPDCSE